MIGQKTFLSQTDLNNLSLTLSLSKLTVCIFRTVNIPRGFPQGAEHFVIWPKAKY